MQTIIKEIDTVNPENDLEIIKQGAKIIKQGGLVAFPTETVYGLGANALDEKAVASIYTAKGRPSDNPLIVHITDKQQLHNIVQNVTETAEKLIEAFWPGPLTLVFDKSKKISKTVSGGLDTVAVRLPENKIARLLIEHAKVPIAAPSANLSGKTSPTIASHVISDLDGRIDMIIDGGDCLFGIESTVVDVREKVPVILRPGSIMAEQIKDACGFVSIDPAIYSQVEDGYIPRAPGQKYKHYSPNADLSVFSGDKDKVIEHINQLTANEDSQKIGIMCTNDTKRHYKNGHIISLGDKNNATEIASNLFKSLREFDRLGVEKIYAQAFSEDQEWLAVMNRLKKAATYDIIKL